MNMFSKEFLEKWELGGVRMRTKHVNQGRYWLKYHSLTPTERLYFLIL